MSFLFYQNSNHDFFCSKIEGERTVLSTSMDASPGGTKFYTRAVVSEHSSPASAWIIISNMVYNVTTFFNEHPGGPDILRHHAGTDVTKLFEEKPHSTYANSLLKRFWIGEVVEADRTEASPVFSLADVVAMHKKGDDVVFVIHNKVYSVSKFIGDHPGGAEPLKHQSGLDASSAFDEVRHTAYAKDVMKKYYIGELHPRDRVARTAASMAKYVKPSEGFKYVDPHSAVGAHIGKQLILVTFLVALLIVVYWFLR